MALHKFKIGQLVDLTPGKRGMPVSGRPYAILRLLPAENGQNLYRIKSVAEAFERIARESELTQRA